MDFPSLFRVRQVFPEHREPEPVETVHRLVRDYNPTSHARPGATVAVAVGSRGIRHLPTLVRSLVEALREQGLTPFVMPAMGSHGGATAEGQKTMLADLGVTEETVGAPVRSSMAVTAVGCLPNGADVFLSNDALAADHLVVINRVKAHTAFRDKVESGLCKMLAVGCGKHEGAKNMHKFGLAASIVPSAEIIVRTAPVLFGLALVETPTEEIHSLHLVPPEDFAAKDEELLVLANSLLPRIPTDDLDLLVVDEIGKNISGAGMDPNIIGFWRRDGGERKPDYRTLVVLDITGPSHGNALGIGLADLTTRRVWDMVDFEAMYTNALTSGVFGSARMPLAVADDREAIKTTVSRLREPAKARIVRIQNTRDLGVLLASQAVIDDWRSQPHLAIDGQAIPWNFDDTGRLRPFPC